MQGKNMNKKNSTTITVAYGDGIGSEIMEATLMVLREAGADITIESVEIGKRIYDMGSKTGILRSSWDVLRRNKILLKAPTFTPDTQTHEGAQRIATAAAIMEKFALEATEISGEGMAAWAASTGENFALFEAAHDFDFTPAIAGKNIANPSGMMLAAVALLSHIGQNTIAGKIQTALERTIKEGLHTADIYQKGVSKQKLGTKEFAEEVVARMNHSL